MDRIEWHPLDAEIEDDHVLDPFGIESERSIEMSSSRKTPSSETTGIAFGAVISVNIPTVALLCLEATVSLRVSFYAGHLRYTWCETVAQASGMTFNFSEN
jgi:hypothetical protein